MRNYQIHDDQVKKLNETLLELDLTREDKRLI